jgi:hypothetical protein
MKVILLLLFPVFVLSQSVYLPATHPVYRFLDKMEAKQAIVDFRDVVKPLSRIVIARKLMQIDTLNPDLTSVELAERRYYMEEFHDELKLEGYQGELHDRWHIYEYQRGKADFNIDFIAGYSNQQRADGKKSSIRSNGLLAYGYLGNTVGLSLMYRDNNISGSNKNIINPLSNIPANGFFTSYPNSIQYSTVSAQASVDIGDITVSIEMLPNTWGTGENGTLIFSNKAPSFPQIKLQFPIGDDMSFTYIHGWLYSDLIDSLRSYQVDGISGNIGFRKALVQKYIAAHIWEFTPISGLDLAVGESEVYGGRGRNPELIYLIPIMFFNAAEKSQNDIDNSQIFASVDANFFKNHSYHATFFIDEIAGINVFDSDKQRNQIGITVGGNWYDLIGENTRVMLEYTRTQPWIYNHKFPDATYQNHSINLGHWIGQNADLFTAGIWFRPAYNLEIGLRFESLRKGGKDSTAAQYRLPSPDFLYGPKTKRQSFGIMGSYEPLRDVVIDFHIFNSRFSTDVTSSSTSYIFNPKEYIIGPGYSNKWDLFFGVRYNFD